MHLYERAYVRGNGHLGEYHRFDFLMIQGSPLPHLIFSTWPRHVEISSSSAFQGREWNRMRQAGVRPSLLQSGVFAVNKTPLSLSPAIKGPRIARPLDYRVNITSETDVEQESEPGLFYLIKLTRSERLLPFMLPPSTGHIKALPSFLPSFSHQRLTS